MTEILAHYNETLHVLSLSWNNLVTDSSVDFVIDMLGYNEALGRVCLIYLILVKSNYERQQNYSKNFILIFEIESLY
jgi:hypothetical protein